MPEAQLDADDRRVFRNLFQAREEAWRAFCDLENLVEALLGDLSAIEGCGQSLAEDQPDISEVTGIQHCARRAIKTARKIEALRCKGWSAAFVARGNDTTRLSVEVLRPVPIGPHKEDYSQGIEAEPKDEEAAHG